MEELYAEGLATRGDPESCVDDPRGDSISVRRRLASELHTRPTAADAADERGWRADVPVLLSQLRHKPEGHLGTGRKPGYRRALPH